MSNHQLYLFYKNKYEQNGGLTIINDSNIHNLVKLYITEKNELPNDLKDKNINDWDVSNITDMSYLFKDYTNFNEVLNKWDVSKVVFMSGMFENASSFN
ncbi:MAG: BspA family leucine-rich repeat surface protein, partial [Candidatus Fonsibacter sp.]